MPTAAKIVAAVMMALTMFLAADASKAGIAQGAALPYFSPATAAVGFLTGWMVMGGLVGRGFTKAIGSGLRTAVTAVFWVLLLFSIWQMVELSLKKRYDGPIEAILGIFDQMVINGRLVLQPGVLITLAVGGVLTGWAAHSASRRWS